MATTMSAFIWWYTVAFTSRSFTNDTRCGRAAGTLAGSGGRWKMSRRKRKEAGGSPKTALVAAVVVSPCGRAIKRRED